MASVSASLRVVAGVSPALPRRIGIAAGAGDCRASQHGQPGDDEAQASG
jgi:hypothetical protein